MFRPLLLSAAALLASGCTLVTGNFTECATADDCGTGRTCVSGYCVEPGCNDVYGAKDDPNAIPIGAALPLTVTGGGQDQSEVQGLNAILLAVEELNQRQGVAGRPFALYVCDTAGDAAKIKEQVGYLIDTKKVPAVLTSGSGQTLAASSVSIGKGALLMTATSTSPELTDVADKPGGASVGLLWRTAPSDAIQGRVIADLLTNSANASYGLNTASKIALLYVNDVYGQGLSGVLHARLAGASGKTVVDRFYARGAADAELDALVANLDADNPDVTVVIGFPDDLTRILPRAVGKTNLMRSSGHKWLFTDAAKDPALFADANVKAMIESSFGTAPAQGAGSAYGTFKSRFQNRFSVNPDSFSFTSHSYDAMYLLALSSGWAIGSGSGELTGARMAEGLTQVSSGTPYQLQPDQYTSAISKLQAQTAIDIEGASGKLNFDAATGEAPSPIEIWQIASTGFTTVETREPPP